MRLFRIMTVALAMALGVISAPQASAEIDVYTTPGVHEVNGRLWSTTCGRYSTQVERCRTEIWATTITMTSGGGFTRSNGWVFNNLTYKPVPRAVWGDNPLANTRQWTAEDGRLWRTECDTPTTGRNGCRSETYSSVVLVRDGRAVVDQAWVFNNIVRFSTSTATASPAPSPSSSSGTSCDTSVLPAGYAVTNGVPHAIKPPYTPVDQFNPVSVALFIDAVSKSSAIAADTQLCLMRMAGKLALSKAVSRSYAGETSLWYPYGFAYSANPSTPTLQPPWYSGIAQGAMLSALGTLHDRTTGTEAATWRDAATRTLNSFLIPYSDGGVRNYLDIKGQRVLMFEEYPTGATPTSVLNGQHVALIALDAHYRRFGDVRAKALFDEGVAHYDLVLEAAELPVEGGIMSTYDLVRGYAPAPLRYVSLGGSVSRSKMNATVVDVPTALRDVPAPNVIVNPTLGTATGWKILGSGTTIANGVATVRNDGAGWTGIEQRIPGGTFRSGQKVSLQFQAKATYPFGLSGISPRYVAYQVCPSGTTNLLDQQKNRGDVWAVYRDEFTVRDGSCTILLQFLTATTRANDTVVQYDNISLRRSDTVGAALTPRYDLFVWRTPVNNLTLFGTGLVAVEVYTGGRWHQIIQFNALPEGRTVQIPEEYTGRNIHYGYHDTSHIAELQSLYTRSGLEYFKTYAERWLPLAPNNAR
ncbi:hypothetical protein TLA_TLA_01303 [Tessaracoccus lapidicaptus]|nr:hypothetical protein TLA_TLA_01303 [Tessaracoccus lapidicaptus]